MTTTRAKVKRTLADNGGDDGVRIDTLVDMVDASPSAVLTAVGELEQAGEIYQTASGVYRRTRQ